jgi:Xaa-Pro aminopeptidase
MQILPSLSTLAPTLRQRREKLAQRVDFPAILWSGQPSPRNFPKNLYPFRASSHFIYFAGIQLPNAAIALDRGQLHLFADEAPPSNTLWHGETPSRSEIAAAIGADAHYPKTELRSRLAEAATLPALDRLTQLEQADLLGRSVVPVADLPPEHRDRQLAEAIVSLRLIHDLSAIADLRQAAACTVEAHYAGMHATAHATTEAKVRAAMEGAILARNFTCAYNSIVTVRGEILHNESYANPLNSDDLILADVGAETPTGWAADVTRTWPVSGRFSATQRDLYELVRLAHDACIAKIAPGVEYREVHLLAAEIIAEGLVNLGILRGKPEDLVAMDAHALFFPHGVGHLLGLDVHDLEDLGDLAGYATGRVRSDRFGLGYLRLDRPLQPGMLVTVEPGFYQVPAILNDPERRSRYGEVVNWDRLSRFQDVRGIRIEDDVLITENGSEILTDALPVEAAAIEQIVRQ